LGIYGIKIIGGKVGGTGENNGFYAKNRWRKNKRSGLQIRGGGLGQDGVKP
jgi:hypothetical protein